MALEVMLFTGLVLQKRYRKYLLVAGITFHMAIAILHGLISFGLAMFGALVLFLRPVDAAFAFDLHKLSFTRWWRSRRVRQPLALGSPQP